MKIKVSKIYSLITLNINCNYIIITLKFNIYVKTKKFSIKINKSSNHNKLFNFKIIFYI